MTFAVYTDEDGYIGEVSAPTRQAAMEFLDGQGYAIGTYELRELFNEGGLTTDV